MNSVPPSLVSLVSMILYGPNIEVSSLKLVLPSLSCYSTTATNKSSFSGTLLAKCTAYPVFSLNFSSVGKGPFMDGKAKNIYFSKGRGGGGTVE